MAKKAARVTMMATSTGVRDLALDAQQALSVAQADAARIYRDLTDCSVRVCLEDDGWHVDYDLKSPHQ
jgi:hypothetical protein